MSDGNVIDRKVTEVMVGGATYRIGVTKKWDHINGSNFIHEDGTPVVLLGIAAAYAPITVAELIWDDNTHTTIVPSTGQVMMFTHEAVEEQLIVVPDMAVPQGVING